MSQQYLTTLLLLTAVAGLALSYTNKTDDSSHSDEVHPAPAAPRLIGIDGVAVKAGGSAELRCVSSVPGAELSWYKDDRLLEDDDKNKNKYKFSHENNSLIIEIVGMEDLGVYQCEEGDHLRANVTLYSVPFVRNGPSINTSPSNSVTLDCRARGFPSPVVTWYSRPADGADERIVPDGTRYVTENTTAVHGLITINDVKYTDYRVYTCVANNTYGSGSGTTLVRVKSPLKPLWPALLIVIQVAILAVIIFFYEKRRKQQMEKEKKLEAEFNKARQMDTGRSEGVRQRKSM